MRSLWSLLIVGCLSTGFLHAAEPGKQEARKAEIKSEIRYLLYLPKEYDTDKEKKWPVIVFLHGAGERGNNLDQVKRHGPPKLVENGKDLPFIVVSPQCAENSWWNSTLLTAMLDQVIEQERVDQDRIYLTGLSMGGFGTWEWAMQQPDRFAAIAPICGGGNTQLVRRLRNTPTWVFHGAKDKAVPLSASEAMVDALKKAGGDPKFTVYPELEHDSWTVTYDNPELYDWFLQHHRGKESAGK